MHMPRTTLLLGAALFVAGCAADESRGLTLVESFPGKTLQSSPYEVTTYAWLRGISRADIHAIETLVEQRRDIHQPILRMMAVKNDRVQVTHGARSISRRHL